MKYVIKGEFRMGRQMQKFKKEVNADNEKNAKEKLYAELGSKHKVKRRFVKIGEINAEK